MSGNGSTIGFIEIVFAIVIAWILVDLWGDFINALAYNTLHLDKQSLLGTFLVAGTVTMLFLGIVFFSNSGIKSSIEGAFTGGLVSNTGGGIAPPPVAARNIGNGPCLKPPPAQRNENPPVCLLPDEQHLK
jgi:hypothetical protein